jgi:hypothetical protein
VARASWCSIRSTAIPEVLYCTEAEQNHSTILWLDEELRRRGRLSLVSDEQCPRIVVVLEERNSMQTLLRDYWRSIKSSSDPMMSPALAALDRLASQGRSLNITVILAAQAVAKVDIGQRNSYGAFALAGRLPESAWKLIQTGGSKKPPISTKPGRFGWVAGDSTTVFQAAFPDLKKHSARIREWALAGEHLLDVKGLMQQLDTPSFPSSGGGTAPDRTVEQVTLTEFAQENRVAVQLLRTWSTRYETFPKPMGTGAHNANVYDRREITRWYILNREGEAPLTEE